MLLKASVRYQLFVFRSIFLQTSCCQVRSPREIYPQVHREIINLTCMKFLLYINIIISYSFRVCKKWQCAYEQETLPSWINYFITIGWKIPCGPTEIATLPKHGISGNIASFFTQYRCQLYHLGSYTWLKQGSNCTNNIHVQRDAQKQFYLPRTTLKEIYYYIKSPK